MNFETPKTSKRCHHRSSHTGASAFIPRDTLKRPRLVALATRLNMSAAQQATFTAALIEESQGNRSNVTTSYATADRSRRNVVQQLAKDYKEQWVAPDLATLHWDSKLITSLTDKNASEERLYVVVGNAENLKLLGVPIYRSGEESSGNKIANLTLDQLNSWHCTESIVNMTFDTTASNTGHVSAACVTIQQRLGKALLWSGCRHHIGEVVLSHVFEDLKIETSRSPDVVLFPKFRKNLSLIGKTFKKLSLTRFESTKSYSQEAKTFLSSCSSEVLRATQAELKLRRDDYKEFIYLCTLFLDTEDTEDSVITFNRPGALHKARWMAKLIYSINICRLQQHINNLPRGSITTAHQVQKIYNFVVFVTYTYSTWWVTCSSAVDAPWNDLQLFRKLLFAVNANIAKSAIRAFQRHFWYLTAWCLWLYLAILHHAPRNVCWPTGCLKFNQPHLLHPQEDNMGQILESNSSLLKKISYYQLNWQILFY